ncbi:TonB-dependent receptor [Seonamhaeicola algicola]|uniref:TonB-dependent receptor n=1 Tax=Seonamhaeicola algicola TaxID=1719036 RepID=A0A5C7AMZ6_9FLAO|nr:TonB-dependent receptor [Seonamhaeicola algicola]TXE10136.1 TonB-dependent receptor [Seonamhaeicola algicola]
MKIKLLEKLLFKEWQFKAFLIACICTIGISTAQAQTLTINGQITDNAGEPLVGATVIVVGTSTGAVTDFDGNYSIKAATGSKLNISYLGYVDEVVTVGTSTTINIKLNEDTAALDEVVVVGYGTQKRKEITGAVGQVKNEDLVLNATADLGTALQGSVAGVNVTASSGQPGAESNVLIRGIGSINGVNTPLYVVDGIPFDGDPKLSIDEIETVDVLKDAASTAVYGTRGANGVILITTKKGKEGIMKMNIHTWYGLQSITSGLPLMELEDHLYATHLRSNALNGTNFGNTWTPIVQGTHQLTNNSDLTDIIQQDSAPIQNHNLSISGGKDGLAYNINASFFKQDGMLINSGYERFNVRANTQYRKGNWNISTGMGFRVEERDREPWQLLLMAYKYNPYSQQLDPDATEIENPGSTTNNDAINLSQNQQRLIQTDRDNVDSFDANMTAKYNFNDNLTYTARVGFNISNSTRRVINPLFVQTNEDGEIVPPQVLSGIRETYSRRTKQTFENFLNYKKSFGNHNFNWTGLFSAETSFARSTFADRREFVSNEVQELGAALGTSDVGNNGGRWNNRTINLMGMMTRLQYNFKGKYLLSGAVRRDGSSQFSEDFRWGNFFSTSVGWNVSDEAFWQPLKRVATSLKLRAGYGEVGNEGFEPYSNQATIQIERDAILGPEEADALLAGAIQERYANDKVKWETSISKNAGFELGLFKNKLNISADFYKENKRDLLLPLLLPPTTAGATNSTVIINIGDMENKGMEWSANYKHKGKLSWNVGLTYTKNENIVTRMSGGNDILYLGGSQVVQGVPNEDLVSAVALGYPAASFFLIKTDGIIDSQEELDEYNSLVGGNANLGDLKYVDAPTVDTNNDGIPDAGDGVINLDDRQFAGGGLPEFEMGLNFGANYKNFDFSMQWYGAFGGEVMNGSKAFAYKSGRHQDLVHQWSPQNTNSLIPTDRGRDHENYRGYTDYWLEDASFARLRNVAIGYTIPKDAIEKHGISNIRIYLSAQNAITITDYTGFDPEVGNNGFSTRGLDRGSYPVSSSFRLGVQFAF